MTTQADYEHDFHAWAMKNAALIRQGRFSEIDIEHIAEELEDMGASRERELESRLGILIAHLLKWQFQPQTRSSSWRGTIKEQRRKINRLLRKNPSLKMLLAEAQSEAYGDALALVERDTGIDESQCPTTCPFSMEQALDEGFWPEKE